MAGREARRNEERLHYKFIYKYFEHLHPDLFMKAEDLYYEAKEKNPQVKDLTKTEHFMTTVTPSIPVPRYYNNRNLKRKNHTTQEVNSPQMVLEIQLQSPSTLLSTAPVPPSSTSTEPVPEPSTVPVPPSLTSTEPVPEPSTVPVPPPLASTEPDSAPSHQALLIPENVYKDLLFELQKDPQLQQILNDFTRGDELNDDGDMFDMVWNDMQPELDNIEHFL